MGRKWDFSIFICAEKPRERKVGRRNLATWPFGLPLDVCFLLLYFLCPLTNPQFLNLKQPPPPPSFSFFIYSNFASLFSVGLVLLFGLFGFLLFLFFSSSLCFLSPRNWCFSDKDQRTLFMLFFNLCALRKKQSTS